MSLVRLFGRFASATESVSIAETAEEKLALGRFRYACYVVEQRDEHPAANHADKTIWTEEDDDPETLNFYAGTPDDVRGAMRVRVWSAGAAPDDLRATYDMNALPGIDQVAGCETSGLMFQKGLRGTSAVLAMMNRVGRLVVEEHRVEANFACCLPGLLPAYRRLGFQTYGASAITGGFSLLLPVICLPFDLAYLKQVGSPWYPLMKDLRREGVLPTGSSEELQRFVRGAASVVAGEDRIAVELGRLLERPVPDALSQLSAPALAALAKQGLILEVKPGETVVAEGTTDREMFLVMEGTLEVLAKNRLIDGLGPGQWFGEVSFFHDQGGRRATVRAASPARLLLIRRRFLERLRKENPAAAFEVYDLVAGIMARRLSEDMAWMAPVGADSVDQLDGVEA